MSKPINKPTVFLTFANSSKGSYLNLLRKESALLRDLFLPLHRRGEIEMVREESLENIELAKLLNQYKGKISIFHYGGHADGSQLFLEGGKGDVNGLADLLSLQTGLKLVFLNGCSTQGQAMPYIEAGVKAVLATSSSISDTDAVFFAEHFYHALINNHTIGEAFISATGALKVKSAEYNPYSGEGIQIYRDFVQLKKAVKDQLPWQLYVAEGHENVLDWNLQKVIAFDEVEVPASRQNILWPWLVIVAVLMVVATRAYLVFFARDDVIPLNSPDEWLGVTVNVHGPEGEDDLLLRGEGEITISDQDTIYRASINTRGQAVFNSLPKGEKLNMGLQAEGYQLNSASTGYFFERDTTIDLEVALIDAGGSLPDAGANKPGKIRKIEQPKFFDNSAQQDNDIKAGIVPESQRNGSAIPKKTNDVVQQPENTITKQGVPFNVNLGKSNVEVWFENSNGSPINDINGKPIQLNSGQDGKINFTVPSNIVGQRVIFNFTIDGQTDYRAITFQQGNIYLPNN